VGRRLGYHGCELLEDVSDDLNHGFGQQRVYFKVWQSVEVESDGLYSLRHGRGSCWRHLLFSSTQIVESHVEDFRKLRILGILRKECDGKHELKELPHYLLSHDSALPVVDLGLFGKNLENSFAIQIPIYKEGLHLTKYFVEDGLFLIQRNKIAYRPDLDRKLPGINDNQERQHKF